MPKVSFIIPAYNAQATIQSCIQSILTQKGSNFEKEIIVVDNDSNDATASIAKSFDMINIVFEKKRSRGLARQTGIKNSTGDYIAFIDSDIILHPDWTSELLSMMLKKPQLGGVQGSIEPMIEKKWHWIRWHRSRFKTFGTFNHLSMITTNMIPVINTAACLWRRTSLTGEFNNTLPRAEDIDFTMQVLANGYSLGGTLKAKALVRWDRNFIQWVWRFYEQAKCEKFVYQSWGLKISKNKPSNIINHPLWVSLPLYVQLTELLITYIFLFGLKKNLKNGIPSEKIFSIQDSSLKTFKYDSFYPAEDVRTIFWNEFICLYNIKTFKCLWVHEDENRWSKKTWYQIVKSKFIIQRQG